MPTITIEPSVYAQLEAVAQAQQAKTEEIAHEAFRFYLWEQSRRKIAQESKLYRRQHAELKARYLGQYIAMHAGEVIDHDVEFQPLYQRVRDRFGQTPVMITHVEQTPEKTLTRHGFRFEQ